MKNQRAQRRERRNAIAPALILDFDSSWQYICPMAKKPRRNDPCYCGSGEKYKHCCQEKDESSALKSNLAMIAIAAALLIGLALAWNSFSGGGGGAGNCPPGTVWSPEHQHCH